MTMRIPGGLVPLATYDGEDMRARALDRLRARLGREPTVDDIKAEHDAEERAHPRLTIRKHVFLDVGEGVQPYTISSREEWPEPKDTK